MTTDHAPWPMPSQVWVYRARLVYLVDGDTQDLIIDQGMHGQRVERLRLLGINCPETKGPTRLAGLAASAWANGWYATASIDAALRVIIWPLVVQTFKADDFGRYLARVWAASTGQCLNDDLLVAGHAVVYREGAHYGR